MNKVEWINFKVGFFGFIFLTGCSFSGSISEKYYPPTSDVSGQPAFGSSETYLDYQVSGERVTNYQYKLGPASSIDCRKWEGYSNSFPISKRINEDLSSYADGLITLCVLAQDSVYNVGQDPNSANLIQWYLDRTTTTISIVSTEQSAYETDSSYKSITISSSIAKPYPITVRYTISGTAQSGLDFDLPTSGSVTIPANQTTADLRFRAVRNSSSAVNRYFQLSLISTDSKNAILDNSIDTRFHILDVDAGIREIVSSGVTNGKTTCTISNLGNLRCWGNAYTGDGTSSSNNTPTLIDSGTSYSKISISKYSLSNITVCGITTSGVLKCWGSNNYGQVGDNSTVDKPSPTVIDAGTTYSFVNVADDNACGITTAGVLKCWGNNGYGQLGDGTGLNKLVPTIIDPGVNYTTIATGQTTCGITSLNVLKCWGYNLDGSVGDNTLVNKLSPTVIDAGTNYSKITLDNSSLNLSTCGITSGGVLKCWGDNSYGQLGDNTTVSKKVPTVIDAGVSYASVSLFSYHACGITSGGVLKCWGYNLLGTVGNGTTINQKTPVIIDTGQLYSQVSVGNSTICGITISNKLKCWGENSNGELGIGSIVSPQTIPVSVDPASDYSSIFISTNTFPNTNFALTTTGVLKALGSGNNGDSNMATNILSPILSDINLDFKNIFSNHDYNAAAFQNFCALGLNNKLYCKGKNTYNNLGDGSAQNKANFSLVDGDASYSYVSNSYLHSCGLTDSWIVKCWGKNTNGQLGDGTTVAQPQPKIIDSSNRYISIITANSYDLLMGRYSSTCGITTTGVLKCWGSNNFGNLGDGTTTNRTSPVIIDSGTSYIKIQTNALTTCGITSANKLKCWGNNGFGQIGNGTTVQNPSPQLIDSSTNYSDIFVPPATCFAGSCMFSVCGITTANDLKCWGYNMSGVVGDGTTATKTSPVLIDSGNKYSKIFIDVNSTAYGIMTNGALKAWGSNSSYQIGDGTNTTKLTPTLIDSGTSYRTLYSNFSTVCGITSQNYLKCWGSNSSGQAGVGSIATTQSVPALVDGTTEYDDVTISGSSVCGLQKSKKLKCWGDNSYGQTNNNTYNMYFPKNIMTWHSP